MKKLLTLSATLLAMLIMIACSNEEKNSEKTSSEQKTEQSPSTIKKKKSAKSIDDFKQTLIDNNFTIDHEQEKSFSLVQAKNGKAFVLSDGSSVEIYQYDSDNDYFKKIQKEKTLLGQSVNIYGNFVVLITNPTKSKDKIIEIFKNLN